MLKLAGKAGRKELDVGWKESRRESHSGQARPASLFRLPVPDAFLHRILNQEILHG